ncbi:tyrosine-type recombinase/integrase [Pseudomonas sp. BC115LW]|uniref:tyrosine-type recombinase/integrase n=1 Tax=Pseudomonas sp. BC115LW TaxID=2683267 RepID=UPI00141358C8|nr:tyrosine-type recombinase/integrase [Pseudomonas sp. BC115LW]NBB36354.1 tyrosine-type recombinase/integrase [Pseudomonas sp. BC115LW]
MPDNLIQKKNESTWYVRLDVPKDVRRALGNRTVLIQSLKTGMRSEAMVRRLPILAQWKADIAAAREQKIAAREQWRPELADKGSELEQRINARLLDAIKNPSKVSDFLSRAYRLDVPEQELPWTGKQPGHPIPSEYAEIMKAAFKRESSSTVDAVLGGSQITADFMVLFAKDKYKLSQLELEEARELIINPTSYKPRSPISKSMIDAWSLYLVSQIESLKTRESHKSRIEKISEFLTTEGAPLTFDTIHKFVKTQGGARQTLLNYMWSGRDFWKWAIKYNTQFREEFNGQQCPFDGHDLPKVGREAGESYVPFTRKEVEDLHTKSKESGKDDLANLIVFGAFTGARIEEIGRIEPGDTIFDNDGEPIGFHIPKAKSVAGVRDVPLHPSLVPLYKHLCTQAPSNDGYLFKGGRNKYGIRLDGLSKQFGRMKKKAEFSHLHVFHSIRKTTTTELHRAGVGLEVLPYIVGHENKSFTLSVYSDGCSFEQKVKAIQLLHFDFEK